MARTVAISTLLASIRSRAEFVDVAYIDPDELLEWVNASIAELQDLLIRYDQDSYVSASTASVTATEGTAALPSDFYKLVLIEDSDGNPLRKFNLQTRHRPGTTAQSAAETYYRIMGGQLHLEPTPAWSGTLTVWYVPAPPTLTTSDSWDGVAGWEEYVICDVCAKAATKADLPDAVSYLRAKAVQAERIQRLVERDQAEPGEITVDRSHWLQEGPLPWL